MNLTDERLGIYLGINTRTFSNRKISKFKSKSKAKINPVGQAYYAFSGEDYNYSHTETIAQKLEKLLQYPKVSSIEVLIFWIWTDTDICKGDSSLLLNTLVSANNQLMSLKAIFIGDKLPKEFAKISGIKNDISPILQAYPNLEMLQIHSENNLEFSPLRHDKLEALIVQPGGLYRETIAEICELQLPALEHLELWLGNESCEGDLSVEDLMPILKGDLFPNLTYLGLSNSEYSDDLAEAIVNAPVIEKIKVLDLSMGTLSDEGFEVLLDCLAVKNLDILNVSGNYLSDDLFDGLQDLYVHVIVENQKSEYEDRYCSASE